MSEYIIQAAEWAIDKNGNSLYQGCEEIVRCKDCEWSFHSDLFDRINSRYCMWHQHDVYIDDGFCFWGKRKGIEDES